jgi:hypothetical protein
MTIRRFAPVFLKLKAGGDVTERTMLTRVYQPVGDVRSRREVVEYRGPDGRLPGEDLLRQILGERFDDIMGTGEARPTLRVVG